MPRHDLSRTRHIAFASAARGGGLFRVFQTGDVTFELPVAGSNGEMVRVFEGTQADVRDGWVHGENFGLDERCSVLPDDQARIVAVYAEVRQPRAEDLATVCYLNDRYRARVFATVGAPGKPARSVLVERLDARDVPFGAPEEFTLRRTGDYVRKGSARSPYLFLGVAEAYRPQEA